jgi:twinkle protein
VSDSEFVGKEPCPKCGSADNLARYSDGHAHCFSQGCGYYEKADGEAKPQTAKRKMAGDLIQPHNIEYIALPARGLTEATCRKWWYGVSGGRQVAQYIDPETHNIVGQKVRTRDKKFSVLGNVTGQLYGRSLWRDTGKRVCITEGEIDAMSLSQVLDHKWQVVSLPNGASSAKKALAENLEWLARFDEVILCFDNDEAGKAATQECVGLFKPGTVKVMRLPLKDANEMLVAKRSGELVKAFWDAQSYRPDGLVKVSDVYEKAVQPPTMDLTWCWPSLNIKTYGRRYGEAVALGAGTGIGKTTAMTQQIAADLGNGHSVAVFALEQVPAETVKRVAGQTVGKVFHVPDDSWTQEELEAAVGALANNDKLHLYDNFGATDWEVIRERIRYLNLAHGIRIFYLDHLTALAAGSASEVAAELEIITREIGSLVKELDIWLLFVSHLTTPDGASHEEGGRVTIRHFKGSRAIGFWSHFMIGLERDQQSDEPDGQALTVLRVLKDRYTGRSTGLKVPLKYDQTTGLLMEAEQKAVFTDETEEAPF